MSFCFSLIFLINVQLVCVTGVRRAQGDKDKSSLSFAVLNLYLIHSWIVCIYKTSNCLNQGLQLFSFELVKCWNSSIVFFLVCLLFQGFWWEVSLRSLSSRNWPTGRYSCPAAHFIMSKLHWPQFLLTINTQFQINDASFSGTCFAWSTATTNFSIDH